MRAVIHIGTQKTGTTTIQRFLVENREELKKQNVFYSLGGYKDQSRGLYRAVIMPGGPYLSFFGQLFERGFIPSNQDEYWQKYRREIRRNCRKNDTVVFSYEVLSYCSKKEVERLKGLMDSLFDDVTVVLYLRRQPEFLISYFNTWQALASRWHVANYLDMSEENSILAYHKKVESWTIFGKDKIKVRIFDKAEFQDNDLLSDFAHTVGFDIKGLKLTKDMKIGLSSAEVKFLLLLGNHISPQEIDEEFCSLIARLRILLEDKGNKENRKIDNKAHYLNRDEAQRVLNQYGEGNDWIAREYLGRDKLFSDDVSMYPVEVASPHTLTIEKCIEMMAACHAHPAKGIFLPRWLGHFITCFMPRERNRQRFLEKYVK